jgi:hypothetical protein
MFMYESLQLLYDLFVVAGSYTNPGSKNMMLKKVKVFE